jgi:hypothetical protein
MTTNMKTPSILLLVLLITVAVKAQSGPNIKMTPLFDGKTFKNWQVPENNQWWSIKKGVLRAKSDSLKTGSTLWTTEKYKDFTIQLDFKFGEGDIDSGIFMRGESPTNAQIQIGVSGSLQRDMTGSPYVPEKGYPVEAKNIKRLLRPKGWNTMRARAVANIYTVWLNGEEVMQYTLDKADTEGPIGLQLHPGREMEILFKNILLKEL